MAQNHSHSSRGRHVSSHENGVVPHERYQKLKRRVCDMQTDLEKVSKELDKVSKELDRSRKRIKSLKREKELLLDRISRYVTDSSDSEKSIELSSEASSDSDASSAQQSRASSLIRQIKKPLRGRASNKKSSPPTPANNIVNTVPITHTSGKVPKKRASKRPLNAKTMKVQYVEQDEQGNYKLPVQIGILTVLSLGTVVFERDTFHNERYIWPVGYAVKRAYNSMINAESQTMYVCKIEDGGDGPKFVIEAEDQPDKPIIANTATGAWTSVVREANAIRHRDHSNSASGPDYFGFSQATIRKMIQDLPNANKCKNYVEQHFEVMKTRNGGGRRRGTGARTNGNGRTNGAVDSPVSTAPQIPEENGVESNSSNGDADGDGDVVMSNSGEGELESEE
ncbi:ino80 complex subunit iec3 [Gigaspora margarita]|uniref:Ino80 complex subunit iec3 n=2 Tax=Gigasporaceae TaxID=36753 RepID=A0A8H4ESJ1_GIGMA|nr:ino80 complex subunit iec3 [Gigaspora margarita]